MLTYEQFKAEVGKRFMDLMGDDFAGYHYEEVEVRKKGRMKEGFVVKKNRSPKTPECVPTLYFRDIYDSYLETGDLERELKNASELMKNGFIKGRALKRKFDYKNASGKIIFQLINTENYTSLFKDCPHRRFLDMTVVYRWALEADGNGIVSALIDHPLMELMGLTEEKLFEAARDNTPKILPPKVLLDNYNDPSENDMIIATNMCNMLGASVMMYDGFLKTLSEDVGSDLYILPLSVNEVLVFPSGSIPDPYLLRGAGRDIAREMINDDDVLSTGIYCYRKGEDRLVILQKEGSAV
ncbi:MAG: hypothetical protein IKN14_08105 [Clostridiales bacterium]|nr:hypothetical protein [Clostridiales bacterium]